MAENKSSFVLYADQRTIIDLLPNDKAGQLLKHIFAYVNDENPVCNDPLINMAFEPIKLQMKRDLKKWEGILKKRSDAGKASAEKRRLEQEQNQQNPTNPTLVDFVQHTSTNPTDNVTVTVNDNVTVINKKEKEEKEKPPNPLKGESIKKITDTFCEWFNNKQFVITGKKTKFKTLNPTTVNNLSKLKDAYPNVSDWDHAIKMMNKDEWATTTNNLTPEHYLRNNNFMKYLNTTDTENKFRAPWE